MNKILIGILVFLMFVGCSKNTDEKQISKLTPIPESEASIKPTRESKKESEFKEVIINNFFIIIIYFGIIVLNYCIERVKHDEISY